MFGPAFSQFNFGNSGRRMQSPIILQAPIGYRYKQLLITDAQLQALDVTPLTIAAAEPGRILVPISAWIRTNKPGAAAWTTGPIMRLNYLGDTTALMAANFSSLLNTAAPVNTYANVGSVNTASKILGTFNIIGKAIQVQFTSVATKGAGSTATIDVGVAYYSYALTF